MISINVRSLLKERHLTQKVAAELAHISQATLSDIINGKTEPSEQTLRALSTVLGVSVEELQTEPVTVSACPVCGSRSVSIWENVATGTCRIACCYCGLDTEEQRSRAQAVHVFMSFKKPPATNPSAAAVRVLTAAELLSAAGADSDSVRPVWFENRGLFVVPSLLLCGVAERELDLVRVMWWGNMGQQSYEFRYYGRAWRCWSGKPSQGLVDSTAWIDN